MMSTMQEVYTFAALIIVLGGGGEYYVSHEYVSNDQMTQRDLNVANKARRSIEWDRDNGPGMTTKQHWEMENLIVEIEAYERILK